MNLALPHQVPLVHDPALLDYELPPYVCLRVRGMAALKQPAMKGPLLAHCGGPGSGGRCAMDMSSSVAVESMGKSMEDRW